MDENDHSVKPKISGLIGFYDSGANSLCKDVFPEKIRYTYI